ncbi:hypothetical protein [Shewanella sp. MM_2022_3]|uniref:hypothetical protein n=1 Tax=Shewanella sp. MM_2022_3 TaxID=2923280 RepID=UPI001F4C1AA4|nr:hypothetical protein [Shewanella sp. MM_2022_3]MCH7421453.1 hypothetical protein [Shewanella sp. MM_2022_3]
MNNNNNNTIYNYGFVASTRKPDMLLHTSTWDELVFIFSTPIESDDKYTATGFVGCKMSGAYRSTENAIQREFFYVDVDDGATIEEVETALNGYTYLLYTTFSHTPQKPKFRVIMPLETALSYEEWNTRKDSMKQMFKFADPAGFTFCQYMVTPVVSPNNRSSYVFKTNTGKPFDALALAKKEINKSEFNLTLSLDSHDELVCGLTKHLPHETLNHNDRYRLLGCMKAVSIDALVAAQLIMSTGSNKTISYWLSEYKRLNAAHYGAGSLYRIAQVQLYKPEPKLAIATKSKEEKKEHSPFDLLYNLNPDEYLGDVLAAIESNFGYLNLLIADCGTGKNFSTSRTPNNWVVSPLRIIVQQNAASANEENYDVVDVKLDAIEENKLKLEDGRALATWNQLITIIQKHKAGEDLSSLKNITLWVDESHGLYMDLFKEKTLNVVYDIVRLKLFKNVVFMSGTSTTDDYHVTFDKVIRVAKKTQPKYTTKVITDELLSYTANAINTSMADGIVVLWNNVDQIKKLEQLITKKLLRITSNDKDEQRNQLDQRHLKTSEKLPSGYNGIIGTYSIVEGMNVKNVVDTVDVFIVGDECIERIEQVSNRYRKAQQVTVQHIVSPVQPDLEYSILNRKDVVSDAVTKKNALNIVLQSAITKEAQYVFAKKLHHDLYDAKFISNCYSLVRVVDDEFAVNYVGIDNQISNSKARFDSLNFNSYKQRLSGLNHIVCLKFAKAYKFTKEEQEAIDEAVAAENEKVIAEALATAIDCVRNGSVESVLEEIRYKESEQVLVSMLYQALKALNYISKDDVIHMLQKKNFEKLETDIKRVAFDNQVYSYLQSNLNIGDRLYNDGNKLALAESIMNIFRKLPALKAADVDLSKIAKYENGVITSKSATAILKRYIILSEQKATRVNGKKVCYAEVRSKSLSGYVLAKQPSKDDKVLKEAIIAAKASSAGKNMRALVRK